MTSLKINLIGAISVRDGSGRDLTPTSSKAKALLMLVALGQDSVRARSWLSSILWPDALDGANLRNELSVLKRCFASEANSPLKIDTTTVKLDRAMLSIDLLDDPTMLEKFQLAEGLNVGTCEFEEWLTSERGFWSSNHVLLPANRSGTVQEDESAVPTIVLEPFITDSAAERTKLHAFGLHEELVTTLNSLGGALNLRTKLPSKIDNRCYKISGSVREESDTGTLRYIIRVASALSDRTIWTDRFTVSQNPSFKAQEDIVRRIVETFQAKLTDGAWSKIWCDRSTSLSAWETYQRGRHHESVFTRSENELAIQCYRDTLVLDRSFWPASIALGFCLSDKVRLGWAKDLPATLRELSKIVSEAIDRQPSNFYALALQSYSTFLSGDQVAGLFMLRQVVAQNPLSPELLAYLGALYGHSGNIDLEIKQYETALRLTAHPPIWILSNLAIAQATIGHHDTLVTAERVLQRNKDSVRARIAKICELVNRKMFSDASAVAREILAIEPTFTAENWSFRDCYTMASDHFYIKTRLESAGL